MTNPRVYNCKTEVAPDSAVYIDRSTCWGNPFIIGVHGDRDTVIQKLRDNITLEHVKEIRKHLRGKDLICHCKPLPCHGDLLLEIANSKGDWNGLIMASNNSRLSTKKARYK